MTNPANLTAIETTTGTSWPEWVRFLDGIGAKDLAHRDIADRVYEKLEGKLENAGWWSQGVTVAYEQHIGRRQPGQRSDGTYEAAVTKTLSGSMVAGMQQWLDYFADRTEIEGQAITKVPNATATDKRHHWACSLADGSRLNIDVYAKTNDKVTLSITHAKLTSQSAADKWRAHWHDVLQAF